MSGDVAAFLRAQDAAVIDSYVDDWWCFAAALSANDLVRQAALAGRSVEPLADWPPASVRVVRHGAHAELWLDARMAAYRSAFLNFAAQYRAARWERVPAGYQVDHLFSRERVSGGDDPDGRVRLPVGTLVVMNLVDRTVNASFGRLMEGDMVGTGNPRRPVRRITPLMLAKALSIHANRLRGGFAGRAAVANLGHVADEMVRRGVAAALGVGREQLVAALLANRGTVLQFRAAWQEGGPA